jgi:hypothetical protein
MTTVNRKTVVWVGRILSGLSSLLFVMSGAMKLSHNPNVVEQFVGKFGFHESSMTGIGVTELGCVALYVFPKTSVLGAILLTAYLGGAVVTHLRVGDSVVVPIVLGVVVWLGLYLRETRLHALAPLRKNA